MNNHSSSRRSFIKAGISVLASWPIIAESRIKVYHIGLQVHAFRNQIRKEPSDVLTAISRVGFKEIEHTDYVDQKFFGLSPKVFRQHLDDARLTVPTGQTILAKNDWIPKKNDISDHWKKTIDDSLFVGQKYIFSPSFEWDIRSIDEIKRGIEAYNRCGEICQRAGINFGYLAEEKVSRQAYQSSSLYEYLLKEMDSQNVYQQLDITTLTAQGIDPMQLLRKFPHHFQSMRLNGKKNTPTENILSGERTFNIEDMLSFARRSTSIKHWVLGFDTHEEGTLDNAGRNLARFKQFGFI